MQSEQAQGTHISESDFPLQAKASSFHALVNFGFLGRRQIIMATFMKMSFSGSSHLERFGHEAGRLS